MPCICIFFVEFFFCFHSRLKERVPRKTSSPASCKGCTPTHAVHKNSVAFGVSVSRQPCVATENQRPVLLVAFSLPRKEYPGIPTTSFEQPPSPSPVETWKNISNCSPREKPMPRLKESLMCEGQNNEHTREESKGKGRKRDRRGGGDARKCLTTHLSSRNQTKSHNSARKVSFRPNAPPP